MTRGWFGRGKPWDTRYCDPWWPAVVVLGCPYVLHHRPCFCTCSCSFYTPAHFTDTHIHARGICKTPTFKLPKVSCRGKLEVINGTESKAMHQTGLFFPFMTLFSSKYIFFLHKRENKSLISIRRGEMGIDNKQKDHIFTRGWQIFGSSQC